VQWREKFDLERCGLPKVLGPRNNCRARGPWFSAQASVTGSYLHRDAEHTTFSFASCALSSIVYSKEYVMGIICIMANHHPRIYLGSFHISAY
jgi:hypothetical protein